MEIRPAVMLNSRRGRRGCGCGGCFVWMIAIVVALVVIGALVA